MAITGRDKLCSTRGFTGLGPGPSKVRKGGLIFGAISIRLFPSIWRFIRTRVMHPSSSSSVHPYEYCEQPSQSFDP